MWSQRTCPSSPPSRLSVHVHSHSKSVYLLVLNSRLETSGHFYDLFPKLVTHTALTSLVLFFFRKLFSARVCTHVGTSMHVLEVVQHICVHTCGFINACSWSCSQIQIMIWVLQLSGLHTSVHPHICAGATLTQEPAKTLVGWPASVIMGWFVDWSSRSPLRTVG